MPVLNSRSTCSISSAPPAQVAPFVGFLNSTCAPQMSSHFSPRVLTPPALGPSADIASTAHLAGDGEPRCAPEGAPLTAEPLGSSLDSPPREACPSGLGWGTQLHRVPFTAPVALWDSPVLPALQKTHPMGNHPPEAMREKRSQPCHRYPTPGSYPPLHCPQVFSQSLC